MPTNISITGWRSLLPVFLAISVIKSAQPILIGVATNADSKVTAIDPKINAQAPYVGFIGSVGLQLDCVKNVIGSTSLMTNDCMPFTVRKIVMDNIIAIMTTALIVINSFPRNSDFL